MLFAADASLFLSPITGTYLTGEPIVIRVMVNTGADSANAIEGALRYDPKNVEIVSVDATQSLLTSWTRAPSFDNTLGVMSFAGSMSGTSSFSGARGLILSITVRGLRSEEARLTFESGSASAVHAADGTGGNLLSTLTNGVYAFVPKETNIAVVSEQSVPDTDPAIATQQGTSTGEVLGAATGTPEFFSPTHPDQDAWYRVATSSIEWSLPPEVKEVRLSLDRKETGQGTVRYVPPKRQKEITDILDGIWYVHMTREWNDGHDDTFHYRLQIDTLPPTALTVSEVPRSDATDPQAVFLVNATDTRSGVDRYEFAFDGNSPLTWKDDGTGNYRAPALAPGDHEVVVSVFDRAGNKASTQASFRIEYLATPGVTQPSGSFTEGSSLHMDLSGPPRSTLSIAIARDGGSPVTEEYTLDGTGKGSFVSALVTTPGVYQVHATAKLATGAISEPSTPVEFVVESSLIGVVKRNPMIPIAVLGLLVLSVLAWFYWSRIGTDDEEGDSDDRDDDEEDQSPPPPSAEHTHMRSGTIVLGDRPKRAPSLPITRL